MVDNKRIFWKMVEEMGWNEIRMCKQKSVFFCLEKRWNQKCNNPAAAIGIFSSIIRNAVIQKKEKAGKAAFSRDSFFINDCFINLKQFFAW